jgi:high-affinity iron transporter
MNLRTTLGCIAAVVALAGRTTRLLGQESPVRRMANIVSVAIEEYGKGVDESGRLTSSAEYQEALDFLTDARAVAGRLPGERAATARALLDSIAAAMKSKRPPSELAQLDKRFAAALGSEAALELPKAPPDPSAGEPLYRQHCVSCHGPRGMGDGPAAAALNPKPPAIGDAAFMSAASPGMMFRKISVGVSGTAMQPFATMLTPAQRWNIVVYLASLRAHPEQIAEGEGLYTQACIECHGATGAGDGPVARSLSKLPPEIGTFAWQVQRSDSQMAAAVRQGVAGSPMPGAGWMTPAQSASVVAYLRTLPMRGRAVAAGSDSSGAVGALGASRAAISLLEQSLTAARNGRTGDASDRAFDAYLAFEPIETPARARDPGVVASMEKLFTDFKAAVRANDIRGAERAFGAIEANMPRVVDLTRPTGSGFEAFLQSFLIILREGFEAILVIGAVVAFLLKTGHRKRLKSIWMGMLLALVASAATAIVLKTVLGAIPASREIIEGMTLLIAVAVLFSVSYWLISRVEAAKWQQFIRAKVNTALEHGGGKALAFVAFLAVYREGAETALFYQALFNEGPHVAVPITLGIVAGGAALAVIFTLFYRFGVKIPLRPFFSVTSVLLYYMALVFMGKGMRELQEGNAVPITMIHGMPTVEALGLYPTWETIGAQLLLLALFAFAIAKTFWPKRSVSLPTVSTETPVSNDGVGAELAALRAENQALQARLAALESTLASLHDR